MGIFYTGTGDKGKSLVGSRKVDKTCIEIEALGDLDELNSLLGLIKSSPELSTHADFKAILHAVQENLFTVQSNVADAMAKGLYDAPKFSEEKTRQVEKVIEALERKVAPERGFIVTGTHHLASWLDYARAVSRRAERSTLKFAKDYPSFSPAILAYLNRLSSLLFAMARMAAKDSGSTESHPTYR
jgi:cob(I)alamin adenosyltransferase